MEYIFLFVSVAAASARSMLSKRLGKFTDKTDSFGLVNAAISLAAFLLMIAYAILRSADMSGKTLVMSLFYAFFTTSSQLFYMRAMANGRVSSVTFFYSCGFLIPTFAGLIIWEEKISPAGIVGIILLVPALALCKLGSSDAKKRDSECDLSKPVSDTNESPSDSRWMIWALLATLSSGMVGLIQKLHQSSDVKNELGGFLLVAMGTSILLSLALALIGAKSKTSFRENFTAIKRETLAPALICGFCFGAANIINLTLTGIIPAIIFFPAVNGGTVIFSTLAARVFGGEKVSKRQLIGLTFGLVGIILVALK